MEQPRPSFTRARADAYLRVRGVGLAARVGAVQRGGGNARTARRGPTQHRNVRHSATNGLVQLWRATLNFCLAGSRLRNTSNRQPNAGAPPISSLLRPAPTRLTTSPPSPSYPTTVSHGFTCRTHGGCSVQKHSYTRFNECVNDSSMIHHRIQSTPTGPTANAYWPPRRRRTRWRVDSFWML